jgi:hypothetical protein
VTAQVSSLDQPVQGALYAAAMPMQLASQPLDIRPNFHCLRVAEQSDSHGQRRPRTHRASDR